MLFDHLDATARDDRALALWRGAILALLLLSILGLGVAMIVGAHLPLEDQSFYFSAP